MVSPSRASIIKLGSCIVPHYNCKDIVVDEDKKIVTYCTLKKYLAQCNAYANVSSRVNVSCCFYFFLWFDFEGSALIWVG